jgi:hypothetical protein
MPVKNDTKKGVSPQTQRQSANCSFASSDPQSQTLLARCCATIAPRPPPTPLAPSNGQHSHNAAQRPVRRLGQLALTQRPSPRCCTPNTKTVHQYGSRGQHCARAHSVAPSCNHKAALFDAPEQDAQATPLAALQLQPVPTRVPPKRIVANAPSVRREPATLATRP